MPGIFIVLEGIDGSGKGTQLTMLAEWLFRKYKRSHVLLTREPTGITSASDEVRKLLMENKDTKQSARKFLQLFVEDRKLHIENIIKPALASGQVVLSDRYKYSTIVYQQTQGLALDECLAAHRGMLVPDLTIIIDVPVDVAMERIAKDRGRAQKEIFDKEEHFLKHLRENYLKLPRQLPTERILIINGNAAPEKVFEKIREQVENIL